MFSKILRKAGLTLFMGTFIFSMNAYANTHGKVIEEGVMLRQAPFLESADLIELPKDEIVVLGEEIADFVEVKLADGNIAYAEKQYIEKYKKEPEAVVEEKKVDKGQEVVNFALKHVGNPYVYGGNSLTNGTDCSGFTSAVYRNFGVNLQRSSRSQYAGNGKPVAKSDLKPGDLVFYGYNGSISHVAIYMGDNKIVHASTPKTGICVSPLYQRGMAPYVGAKRIF